MKLSQTDIPFDDEQTFDLLEKGWTKGVFQLEKVLGQNWSKKLAPRSIAEIADLISLIRPGCLNSGMTEKYYSVKWDEEKPSYIHEDLRPILESTHSCLIYQEQCMEIARKLCGFTLSEADSLRKAIGHKIDSLMQEQKKKFIDGGVANDHTVEIMEQIWSWVEEFSQYSFNKCIYYKSQIEREDGSIDTINNVKIGDKIKAFNPETRECFYDEVLGVIDTGIKPVFEFGSGMNPSVVACTMSHKVLCKDNVMRPMWKVIKLQKQAKRIMDSCFVTGTSLGDQCVGEDGVGILIAGYRSLGKQPTLDLEMKSTYHNYVSDGIVVSNSHALAYAYLSYATAYYKTHYPHEYFNSMFRFSRFEQKPGEEVESIMHEMRLWDIALYPPSLKQNNANFELVKRNDDDSLSIYIKDDEDVDRDNTHILFGLSSIKQLGQSACDNLHYYKDCDTMSSFLKVMANKDTKINKTSASNLILAGALDDYSDNYNRSERFNLLILFMSLNDREKKEFIDYDGDVVQYVKDLIIIYYNKPKSKRRIPKLLDNLTTFDSSPAIFTTHQSIEHEIKLMGVSLSGTMADYCDRDSVTHNCIDIINAPDGELMILCVVLDKFRDHVAQKSGKPMVFLTLSDSSHTIESALMFEKNIPLYHDCLYKGATLIVEGRKWKGTLVINKILNIEN